MGILDGILSPLKGLFGIEEPQKPKTFVSDKSKTNQAVPIVVGHNYVKLEGIPVFKRVSSDEERVGIVHALCVGLVIASNENTELYVDDIISTDSRFRDVSYSGGSAQTTTHVWRTVRAGSESSAASQWNDFQTWFNYPLSTAFGKGVCHSMVMYRRDADIFTSEPKFWYKLKRANLRSLDSNPNMPDAWADNPYAIIKWYMRDTVVGMEQDESLFGASFDDAIDWLENSLVDDNGTQRKRFSLNGIIQTDKEWGEILDDLQRHSFSKINFINGKYEIAIKGRTTTPALELDENNIVGKLDVEHPDARDRATRVIVTWINPDKQWEEDEAVYPPYDDPQGEYAQALADDGFVENVVKFKNYLTDNYAEAFEFARIKWRESRESTVVKLTAQAEAAQLIQYDVVSVTDTRRGWTDKLFIVEEKEEITENGEEYNLTLSEFNPTVYSWSGQGTYTPVPTYNYNPSKIPAIDSQTFVWNDNTRIMRWTRPTTQQIITEYIVRVDNELYKTTKTESVKLEMPIGTYDVSVTPKGLITGLGEPSGIQLTISALSPPLIAHNASNFTIRVAPYLDTDDDGVTYDVAIGNTTDVRGPTTDYLFDDLTPNTVYEVFARSDNGVEKSDWTSVNVTTTNDPTDIVNLVDGGLDDIFAGMEFEFKGFSPTREIAEIFTQVFDNFERQEDIRTESQIRRQTFEQISESLDTEKGRIDAAVTRIDQVEIDANGNASAISALRGEVDNPVTGLNASYTLAFSASQTASGNADAIAILDTRVQDNEDFASAQLILNSGYDDELGQLRARASLTTDVNGRVTGVIIDDDGNTQKIEFQSDSVAFLDASSNPAIYFDLTAGSYIFDGRGLFNNGMSVSYGNINVEAGVTDNGLDIDSFVVDYSGGNTMQVSSSGFTVNGPSRASFSTSEVDFFCNVDISGALSISGADPTLLNVFGDASITGDLDVAGTITNFTGAHFGLVTKGTAVEQGDIVVDHQHLYTSSATNTITINKVSSSVQQKAAVGVALSVSEIDPANMPAVFNDYPGMAWLSLTYDLVTFNAVGEGVINVCGEGGDIEIGDYICSSNAGGKGMKQADDIQRNYTVAKAREAVTFSSPSECKQIACTYHAG